MLLTLNGCNDLDSCSVEIVDLGECMTGKWPKGSQWRKWDLHVHSPASFGYSGDWKQFIIQLGNADCDVIGINDYSSLRMGRWSERLAIIFADFAAVGEPNSILDVGCGTGSLTFALANRFPAAKITGVDYSQTYVDFARAQTTSGFIKFEQGDAAALPYSDQNFDCALSLLVLNFVPDAERAARELVRVTKRGGVVAAAVWDFRGGMPYHRMLFDTAAVLDPEDAQAVRAKVFSTPLTSPGELEATWKKIGLGEITQTSLTIRMEFQSFVDYWEPFLGGQGMTGSYVKGLDAEKQSLIERHVRLAYLGGADDGPRSFASTAWAVRGVR